MRSIWIFLVFSALYGHSGGFWPFQVFAESDDPDLAGEAEGGREAKRIAIIGMLLPSFESQSLLHGDLCFLYQ